MLVERRHLLERVRASLDAVPVTVLSGPRRSGKTTLARELLSEDSPNYFDLEDPVALARLEQPVTALGGLEGLVVIDEVQRRPDLFSVLRTLVDRRDNRARFLILGSASGDLLRQSSESLAGRRRRIEVGGFDLTELGAQAAQSLWLRGGLPRSYLAESGTASYEWRGDFMDLARARLPAVGGFASPQPRCNASGAPWRTGTLSCGTLPSWHGSWVSTRTPPAGT
jgi:predicted AAA+ superfamily ATPase